MNLELRKITEDNGEVWWKLFFNDNQLSCSCTEERGLEAFEIAKKTMSIPQSERSVVIKSEVLKSVEL